MTKFEIAEEKGRKIFEEFINQAPNAKNWNPTKQCETVDGFFELDDKKIVVEIKKRNEKYKGYTSLFLEVNKWMNICQARIKNNCNKGLYVNILGEDTILIFDLKDISTDTCGKPVPMELPKSSAEYAGTRIKQILLVPTRFAQVFKKDENGKWHKVTE